MEEDAPLFQLQERPFDLMPGGGGGLKKGKVSRQRLIRFAVREGNGDTMQRPMLVDGLNFAPRHRQQCEMKARLRRRIEPPAVGLGKLSAPQFFHDGHVRRSGRRPFRQGKTFEHQRRSPQGFSQLKGQRTAGKNFAAGIAPGGGFGRREMQFDFVEGFIRSPEPGGAALGDHLKAVMPSAFAKGAQFGQPFFIKFDQGARIVRYAFKFHVTMIRSFWQRAFRPIV